MKTIRVKLMLWSTLSPVGLCAGNILSKKSTFKDFIKRSADIGRKNINQTLLRIFFRNFQIKSEALINLFLIGSPSTH